MDWLELHTQHRHAISKKRACDECQAIAPCRALVRAYRPTLCEDVAEHRQRQKPRPTDKFAALDAWMETEAPERVSVKALCAQFDCGHTAVHKRLAGYGYTYEPLIGGEKGYWRREE